MSDWQTVTLEDVTESINTGLDAIRRAPIVEHKTNLRCLRIQDISQNKPFDKWGYTEVKDSDFKKFQLVPNDIIMARTCSTGICYLVKKELPAVFNNGLARIRLKIEKVDPKFIYYVFKSKHFSGYIDGISGGTSVQLNMKIGDLLKYQFNLPPLSKQKEIARILSDLDKKIELNTQINQTLEQIAQALFKSWFVDFDPVRAKVQALSDGLSLEQAELAAMQAISGKTPEELTALSQTQPDRYAELVETAKAFPCEMVVVDGVEVPKGWDTLSFKDFIKEKKEKVGNLKNVPEYSVTNNGIIPRSQKFNKQLSKNPEKNKLLHKTDLVFGMSREVLNWGIMEDEIGAVSSAYHIYSINKDKVNYLYLKMLMQNRFEYFNELIRPSSREGQGFDKELLKEKKVTIPCNILLDKFLHDLNTIKGQMNNITQETESLIFIRNLLLPKLLNGEI